MGSVNDRTAIIDEMVGFEVYRTGFPSCMADIDCLTGNLNPTAGIGRLRNLGGEKLKAER
ncbi:MAG: hypothetical protein EBU26_10335 [Verrucomicrobia bacterium]|nr:hypothetical protein [Verrucomicrobiota bacterium]